MFKRKYSAATINIQHIDLKNSSASKRKFFDRLRNTSESCRQSKPLCNNFGCLRCNLHQYREITKFLAHFSVVYQYKSSENVRVSAKNCLYSFSIPSLP